MGFKRDSLSKHNLIMPEHFDKHIHQVLCEHFESYQERGQEIMIRNDWRHYKILHQYPNALIIMMVLINFNEGLSIMKSYAIKDLFKAYYKVEPSVS